MCVLLQLLSWQLQSALGLVAEPWVWNSSIHPQMLQCIVSLLSSCCVGGTSNIVHTHMHSCICTHTHTRTHARTHTHYMHILTVQKSRHYKILGPCQVFSLTLVYTATPWSGELLSPSVHVSIKQYNIAISSLYHCMASMPIMVKWLSCWLYICHDFEKMNCHTDYFKKYQFQKFDI